MSPAPATQLPLQSVAGRELMSEYTKAAIIINCDSTSIRLVEVGIMTVC